MRPTMLPSLLRVLAENLKFGQSVRLFETARIYQPDGVDNLPDERRAVGIVMAGTREEDGLYSASEAEIDYFDVKGAVEHLLRRLGADEAEFSFVVHPSLHPVVPPRSRSTGLKSALW